MIGVKVTAKCGYSWSTSINATLEEATEYFLNKWFNVGNGPLDKMVFVIGVELV